MRFAMAFAAFMLWAGVASGQGAPTPQSPAAADSTASQSQTSNTPSTSTDQSAAPAAPADPVICHTTQSIGSRLAARGHVARICKTRSQWEMAEDDLRHQMGRMTEQPYQQEPGARTTGSNN